jgi:SAM-dependent methyltransferase
MSFNVGAQAYGRFMGRYSEQLAVPFAGLAKPMPGQRALDVGCGPGALTQQLVTSLGSQAVTAIDPSASFVEAVRVRLPEVDVRQGSAEDLPFADNSFDLALAQLVVHFMADPVAGIAEMARVTRPGGVVGACVWDYGGGRSPLSAFWQAVAELDPTAPGESQLPGAREGHLATLFENADMPSVQSGSLAVRVNFENFAQWWEPFTLGVGPSGDYTARLDDRGREELRARCAEILPAGSFEINAVAWTALASV